MKIPCEIDNVKTLKKGAKITFSIDENNVKELLQNISGFMDMPLTIEILTDIDKQKERLNQISPEQRKKIYSFFKDIASYTGNNLDDEKENMKRMFLQSSQYEDFSLSNCNSQLASDFITWLIEFCFENGIELSEHPIEGLNDIESYLKICLSKLKCCVCGKPGIPVKWDTDTQICLCGLHKQRATNVGRQMFKDEFKVWGV